MTECFHRGDLQRDRRLRREQTGQLIRVLLLLRAPAAKQLHGGESLVEGSVSFPDQIKVRGVFLQA